MYIPGRFRISYWSISSRLTASALSGERSGMFALNISSQTDERAVLKALGRSLAIIEFDPSGTILSANENFCNALGCRPPELRCFFGCALTEIECRRPARRRRIWASHLGRNHAGPRKDARPRRSDGLSDAGRIFETRSCRHDQLGAAGPRQASGQLVGCHPRADCAVAPRRRKKASIARSPTMSGSFDASGQSVGAARSPSLPTPEAWSKARWAGGRGNMATQRPQRRHRLDVNEAGYDGRRGLPWRLRSCGSRAAIP